MIANTPEPPYYAAIFTSVRTPGDQGYEQMAEAMMDLAKQQPGYLGVESARNEIGITISYWKTLQDIANWKQNSDHLAAQALGISKWYEGYAIRICLVERAYNFMKV